MPGCTGRTDESLGNAKGMSSCEKNALRGWARKGERAKKESK